MKAVTYNDTCLKLSEVEFSREVFISQNLISESLAGKYRYMYKVLLAFTEPQTYRSSDSDIIGHSGLYDLILTYSQAVLNTCPNARPLYFGTPWVDDYTGTKHFCVSFICGSKSHLAGHRLRHVVFRLSDIAIPTFFWVSSKVKSPALKGLQYPAGVDKSLLFKDTQFHIAIENCKEQSYFTEKITDCFVTRTVPVYWGCPNIGDFFNLDGIITFDDERDLVEKLNDLNSDSYKKYRDAVEDNYRLVQPYRVSPTERVRLAIEREMSYAKQS